MNSHSGTNNNNDDDSSKSYLPHCNRSYIYLNDQAVTALPKFQYNGADNSPIYQYILSPLAAFLVDHATPKSLAPNSITLLGLCCMISSYLIIWYHCPLYREEDDSKIKIVPEWIFLWNGIAMLIYQTLDNMDGKQARRTGSSSPLGLLFDHGCDAINIIFGSVNWIAAMNLNVMDHTLQIWIIVFVSKFAFFVATWEEYHTGKLILPIFNGPTEGLLLGASLSISSYALGRDFWHQTSLYDSIHTYLPNILSSNLPNGIQNYNLVLLSAIISGINEILTRILTVLSHTNWKSWKPLYQLTPISVLTFTPLFTFWIMDTSSVVHFQNNPQTCMHLIAILFTEMVTQVMMDHIGQNEFNPLKRLILLPYIVLFILITMGVLSDSSQVGLYLTVFTTGAFVYMSMKTMIIIHEYCDVLGIW
eukprot:CAMPEP_0184859362 /NCGR_PEP_ID=MMETSP0580-20130426/4371_1 /TAXON_ID=1118495 /ORGANISM="Dactyliosolen fragilissimus" /LENGTH=418 /DNA_ID=CAMNT_0027355961 /DNA_START=64 /DNA_END=1317 /DNA_ORIENTATION=+